MPANNIAKKVRFLWIDGLLAVPLILLLVIPTKGMLYFLLICIVILSFVERKGMSIIMLLRKIRTLIVGKHRFIRPPWRK